VTQRALATCDASQRGAGEDKTLAVHAALQIDASGKVKSAELTSEPSDLAAAPEPALQRCLLKALRQTAFDCSASGDAVQATALLCMRREPPQ
jgi:hypothetical protein